eukprot:COSAG06_NODE_31874_length_514_cov_1.207229_1_plen_104_part_10
MKKIQSSSSWSRLPPPLKLQAALHQAVLWVRGVLHFRDPARTQSQRTLAPQPAVVAMGHRHNRCLHGASGARLTMMRRKPARVGVLVGAAAGYRAHRRSYASAA